MFPRNRLGGNRRGRHRRARAGHGRVAGGGAGAGGGPGSAPGLLVQARREGIPNLAFSLLALALLAVRMVATGTNRYGFLAWNLFLAWTPWLLLLASGCARAGLRALLVLLAILLLPNAPYMLTDFIHFRLKEGFPWWYDAQLVFTFAATGCLLAVLCLRDLHARARARWGAPTDLVSVVALCYACGLGVYLGRGPAWNSWDVLRRPWSILTNLVDRLCQPGETVHALGLTFTTGTLLLVAFLTCDQTSRHAAGAPGQCCQTGRHCNQKPLGKGEYG